MRLCVRFAVFAPLALGCSLIAHGTSFTQSVQFGAGPADFFNATGTTSGPNGNGLYLFDTNGGTLNSIVFTYTYGFTSSINVQSISPSASSGTAGIESGAQFSSSDSGVTAALNNAVNKGGSVSFGSPLSPVAYDLVGSKSGYTLAPGTSIMFTSSNSVSTTSTDVSAADLAAFGRAGGGVFVPLFNTLTGVIVQNTGGNTTATQSTTAKGNLSLTYNYTTAVPAPVSVTPEPSSLALLGTGALGMFAAARRRFRAS